MTYAALCMMAWAMLTASFPWGTAEERMKAATFWLRAALVLAVLSLPGCVGGALA